MALAPLVQGSQGYVLAGASEDGVQASQGYVLAAGIYPAEFVDASQVILNAVIEADMDVQVSQAFVLVAARGRITDPSLKAWTFTLDGHDYYVLRLGQSETLIYDTHSEQWYTWGSGTSPTWRAYTGWNWTANVNAPTTVYVGDDGNGTVYYLDAEKDVDDDALVGIDEPRPFLRAITGQVLSKSYNRTPCFSVSLIGSIGVPALSGVTLYTSDDRGNTYIDQGTVTISPDDWNARVDWGSLGSFSLPGRLFKIEDEGAFRRIDSLEMDELGRG